MGVPLSDSGAENELRLRRRLWADARSLRAVRELGLTDSTIRRYRLGLKEPYVARATGVLIERALAFPLAAPDGTRTGRWSYLNLTGVTSNAPHARGWGPGEVRTCYSRAVTPGASVLLVPSVVDMWLVAQTLGDSALTMVVACPSQPDGFPAEWRDPRFWAQWGDVVLGLSHRVDEEDVALAVGRAASRTVRRCVPPAGETWADLVRMGGSAAELRDIVHHAGPWKPVVALPAVTETFVSGDFEADPVAIECAFVAGRMHYPVTVERREVEEQGKAGAAVVQRYVTRVLRSDGVLLDVVRLPAPYGTPASGRVLALSDGTRIVAEPLPGRFGTWRFPSIRQFIEAREEGREPTHRPLARLLADIEAHLRSCVWLPHGEDYVLASLFVAATFVHRVFDAFPILLVNGAKGTGKSELGQAIAALSCNGLVAGRITPAGLVRLLAETRGTVVLDDLETIGTARIGDDIAQILKTSYKAATARRVSPGRDGRVEILDYFAPKVVTNIAGADAVLLTRMLPVRTAPVPADASMHGSGVDTASLRDELHTWAMCEATSVAVAYSPFRDAARDRSAEIAAPIRAIASLAGISDLARRLEVCLAAEPVEAAESTEAVLARTIRRLVEQEGVVEVAMPRLMLELAREARGALRLPSSESLGRLLIAIGARAADGAVERRRLQGTVTRVYKLSPRFIEGLSRPAADPTDPFGFCAGRCRDCIYDDVCDSAAPGLRAAKLVRAGGSSQDFLEGSEHAEASEHAKAA